MVQFSEDMLSPVSRQGVIEGGYQVEQHRRRGKDAGARDVPRVAVTERPQHEKRCRDHGSHEPDAMAHAVRDFFPEGLRAPPHRLYCIHKQTWTCSELPKLSPARRFLARSTAPYHLSFIRRNHLRRSALTRAPQVTSPSPLLNAWHHSRSRKKSTMASCVSLGTRIEVAFFLRPAKISFARLELFFSRE